MLTNAGQAERLRETYVVKAVSSPSAQTTRHPHVRRRRERSEELSAGTRSNGTHDEPTARDIHRTNVPSRRRRRGPAPARGDKEQSRRVVHQQISGRVGAPFRGGARSAGMWIRVSTRARRPVGTRDPAAVLAEGKRIGIVVLCMR